MNSPATRAFICYSHFDQPIVESLADDIRLTGMTTWQDKRLIGGEDWWPRILQEIRDSSIFIFALSAHSQHSSVCRAEYSYAKTLNLPIIPVDIAPYDRSVEYTEQIVPYRSTTASDGVRLAMALVSQMQRPLQRPTNDPGLPESPYAPITRIQARIQQGSLHHAEQLDILEQLEAELGIHSDPNAQDRIHGVLRDLRSLDLRHSVVLKIDALIAKNRLGMSGDAQTDGFYRRADLHALWATTRYWSHLKGNRLREAAQAIRRSRVRMAAAITGLFIMIAAISTLIVLANRPPAISAADRSTASLHIYNAGTRPGLAEALASDLRCAGWSVDSVDNFSGIGVRTSSILFRDTFEERIAANLSSALSLTPSERPSSMSTLPVGPLIVITNDFHFQAMCRAQK
jgi:hypothetical protein